MQAIDHSQGWIANLQLEFVAGQQRTQMLPRKRVGPLLVQRPFYPEQNTCHAYLLHPPGGVVGGDRLDLQIALDTGAHALLTTPGATKFYQSAGQTAVYAQRFSVAGEGKLEFLPHENIYFPGANVAMHSSIELQGNSVTMWWEKHCFGRPVISETFDKGQVTARLELSIDNELALTETQRINAGEITSACGLRGHPVMGTFLLHGSTVSADLSRSISELSVQQGYASVTSPLDGLLVIRYLGNSTADMSRYFVSVWQLARPLMTEKPGVQPRIWAT